MAAVIIFSALINSVLYSTLRNADYAIDFTNIGRDAFLPQRIVGVAADSPSICVVDT